MALFLWIAMLVVAVLAFAVVLWLLIRASRRGSARGIGLALAGLLVAVLAGGAAIAGMVNTLNVDDPRPYIQKHYQRAAQLDDKLGGQVYTTAQTPDRVRKDIAAKTDETAQYSSGTLSFLRYPEWLVVVAPNGGGAKIDVDSYDNGYKRYREQLAGSGWPANATTGNGGNNSGK
ncbi:DUF4247 domain-containing protein [Nocardia sp. NPDC005978]|uniref:DUF4247 domain-containing protein n=1 Tax=unclassified Nocardia TaxID=2637762 RepID=UPI0033BBB542